MLALLDFSAFSNKQGFCQLYTIIIAKMGAFIRDAEVPGKVTGFDDVKEPANVCTSFVACFVADFIACFVKMAGLYDCIPDELHNSLIRSSRQEPILLHTTYLCSTLYRSNASPIVFTNFVSVFYRF